MAKLRLTLATTLLLMAVLAACADDTEPAAEPSGDSSSTGAVTSTSPTSQPASAPSYLDVGDLPRTLTLKAVDGRTVPARPFADFAVTADDGVWVSGVAPGAVRYGAAGRITARARIPGMVVQALAASTSEVFVPSLGPNALFRLDAMTGEVLARVELPADPLPEAAVGAHRGQVFVLVGSDEPRIAVIEGDQVVGEIPAPAGAVAVRAAYGALWLPTTDHTVERYALRSAEWTSIPVGPDPRFLDVGFGAVWVMNQGDGSVSRIGARTGATERIAVTGERIGGGDLTVGGGAVWLRTDAAVARIDPHDRTVTHLIDLPPGSASAAATDRMLVITNHDHLVVHLVPLPLP